MNVGICKLRIYIPESRSLKDKRRILQSLLTRMKKQFNISIAEIDDQDVWRIATIGISCVSNHTYRVDEVFESIISIILRDYPTIEIIEKEIDFYS